MKKIYIFGLIVVILSALIFAGKSKAYPQELIYGTLLDNLDSFEHRLSAFQSAVQKQETTLLPYYFNLRQAYKRIETYVVFRYPGIDKWINGGPVPSISTEVVILHKDAPHGLQVIEELMAEDGINYQAIADELALIRTKQAILASAFHSLPLQHWEILEANHLALTRLMTLGLSGFDSPEFLFSLEDALVVLSTLWGDLAHFNLMGPSPALRAVEEHATDAIEVLKETEDYESLDHYILFRNYLIPLQKAIKGYHRQSGFEFYEEVSSNPRAIQQADHLFSKDYLDPLYSMRGRYSTFEPEVVELGKVLFFDPVLSSNNQRACASCHASNKAFSDGEVKSIATDYKGTVMRNAPGLINTAYQSNFFWDMRSQNMNDQIMHVFKSEQEFNTTPDEVIAKLKESKEYRLMFEQAFPEYAEPVNLTALKISLEMYIRSIIALNAKFDRNIRSEENNLTEAEHLGANLFFRKAACATCHFPPMFNGYVPPHYQETEGEILGVESAPKSGRLDTDRGVYERFKLIYPDAPFVDGMFKTSTVRNAEYTAPYMHNGMYPTLEDVIAFYHDGGGAGRGLNIPQQTLAGDSLGLTEKEQLALIQFIKTLSDTSGTQVRPFPLPTFGDARDQRVWGGNY